MLKRLHLKNFTVFADADFEFSPGLNVLVGTNGTGKSHVLKVGYAVEVVREQVKNDDANPLPKRENEWGGRLFYALPDLFRAEGLRGLVSTRAQQQDATVEAEFQTDYFQNEAVSFAINYALDSVRVLGGGEIISKKIEASAPVFIPAKEVLSLSWMRPASEQLVLPIEQNYLHLLKQLYLLPRRNPESGEAIETLTDIVGGEIRAEGETYFLVDKNGRRVAINMVAEGIRKFGTLQKLLANGSLTKNNTLYWDEPEANLNPALLRKLAAILAELARQGFQIILATHSTDLLKEFHILSRQKDAQRLPIKYFGLNAELGEATRIVSTDNFELLPDVVALSEELKQADELEEIFIREDREYYANNRGE